MNFGVGLAESVAAVGDASFVVAGGGVGVEDLERVLAINEAKSILFVGLV